MVTLSKPATGDTSWATPINDNWTSIEKQLIVFQGRLQRDSTAAISLQRFGGDTIDVNGLSVSLGASGLSFASGTDHTITNTGADSGTLVAADTLYYAYVSNGNASLFANSLRLSTTAPSSLNGVKYLDTSGNAANWRFVGYVRTNGSTQFSDSDTQRFVINYYNRRALRMKVTDSTDSWTYTTRTWRSWNNSTANRVEFISNGEDPVWFVFGAAAVNGGGNGHFAGLGLDSTTANSADITSPDAGSGVDGYGTATALYCSIASLGYHYLQLLEAAEAFSTTTWFGDNGIPTFMQSGGCGWVMG